MSAATHPKMAKSVDALPQGSFEPTAAKRKSTQTRRNGQKLNPCIASPTLTNSAMRDAQGCDYSAHVIGYNKFIFGKGH
jgi:hypothetical protein